MRFFIVTFALFLAGCGEYASFYSEDPKALGLDGNSNLLRVHTGTEVVAEAKVIRPEIEGETTFEVDEITADDPTIAQISAVGASKFSIRGLAVGETLLHVKVDGDERDVVPIRIIP